MPDSITEWIGLPLVSQDGSAVGEIVDIFADDASGEPSWLAVRTQSGPRFVPVAEASLAGERVEVPFATDVIAAAPVAGTGGELSPGEERALYEYYAGNAATAVTRAEEELFVSKEVQEAGRVRLRKWVETERVSKRIPVRHDEVRVEREQLSTDEGTPVEGVEIGEAEYEVVLHEEQVVTAKVAVPKERVRIEKSVVTEEHEVEADLRKERIEIEREQSADRA